MPDPLRPEQLLAALLELSEDAVLTLALDGTIEHWSPGAEALYGYKRRRDAWRNRCGGSCLCMRRPGLEALLNNFSTANCCTGTAPSG